MQSPVWTKKKPCPQFSSQAAVVLAVPEDPAVPVGRVVIDPKVALAQTALAARPEAAHLLEVPAADLAVPAARGVLEVPVALVLPQNP